MSYLELKVFQHTCDWCKTKKDVADVPSWATLPRGWGWNHPETSFSMGSTSEELCDKCLEFVTGVEVKFE
jgi:hypothetical protein